MTFPSISNMLRFSLGLAVAMSTIGQASPIVPTLVGRATCDSANVSTTSNTGVTRNYMSALVTQILSSMVTHDPYSLPLAKTYKATENSHPAALSFMTAWRTITKAGAPSILAIDVTNGAAAFTLDVSEGNDAVPSILRGRVKVVDYQITELELFINRGRGDHGFSFSPEELAANAAVLMSPPSNRTKASRETLMAVSEALFPEYSNYTVNVSDSCQFTELGWRVVDPGPDGTGSTAPLSCGWPSAHPWDANARTSLVIDEELGFIVTSGIIPGKAYGYGNMSAFIPDAFPPAQEAQETWLASAEANGTIPVLTPMGATGDVLEVLQFYDGLVQGMQINVYLSGPNMTSPWLS